jgi:hypothetical protein
MGWPDPNDASGAVYDAALDRWGPPMSTRCLGRPSNRWVQTWADDGLLVWISYGREELDRLVFLAAESVFGELPEDPAECRCPSRVGEE